MIDFSTIDANGAKSGDTAFRLKKAGDLVYEQVDKKGITKDQR